MANHDFMFAPRLSVKQVEEGVDFSPKFDKDGLLPVVTTSVDDGVVLMHGYMNAQALTLSIQTGRAHYWSRSRNCLWPKGATSGLVQHIEEIRIDDDQDALWLRVRVAKSGASCHVGYRSCFYRAVVPPSGDTQAAKLEFTEKEKLFDAVKTYGENNNPTRL